MADAPVGVRARATDQCFATCFHGTDSAVEAEANNRPVVVDRMRCAALESSAAGIGSLAGWCSAGWLWPVSGAGWTSPSFAGWLALPSGWLLGLICFQPPPVVNRPRALRKGPAKHRAPCILPRVASGRVDARMT